MTEKKVLIAYGSAGCIYIIFGIVAVINTYQNHSWTGDTARVVTSSCEPTFCIYKLQILYNNDLCGLTTYRYYKIGDTLQVNSHVFDHTCSIFECGEDCNYIPTLAFFVPGFGTLLIAIGIYLYEKAHNRNAATPQEVAPLIPSGEASELAVITNREQ